MDTQVEIKNSSEVREVLHNSYQSCNLIGPNHFLGRSPLKFDFIHQIVSYQEVHAGHETKCTCANHTM